MVKMLFYIQFRSQLGRTNPDLISSLENTVASSAAASGGTVEAGRRILSASFDEDRIGFWLDMTVFLDNVHRALNTAAPRFYGCALMLGRNINESAVRKLCRSVLDQNDAESTGIWCSDDVRKALEFYIEFREPAGSGETGIPEGQSELKGFRPVDRDEGKYSYRDKIKDALARENDKNTLFLSDDTADLRDGIYRYCADVLQDTPPLIIRFGSAGHACFIDAFTPALRSFITASVSAGSAVSEKTIDELDSLHSLLFMERLRGEWSPYMKEKNRLFIRALLRAYTAAVKIRAPEGVPAAEVPAGILILEDIGKAADGMPAEICAAVRKPDGGEDLLVIGADGLAEDVQSGCAGIFSRVLNLTPENPDSPESSARDSVEIPEENIPVDVWEVAYNIFLLGRYFPSYLFPRLFEEEGLNREMYFRSLQTLSVLGENAPRDTWQGASSFASRAENILGKKAEKVRAAVRNRLLHWVVSGKIRPCFGFLKNLSELGEKVPDVLVLKSLMADVLNGTWEEIEKAVRERYLGSIVRAENVSLFTHIYRTLKVLVWSGSGEIERVFLEPPPSMTAQDGTPCYPGYQAQVLTNLAAFYLGGRNTDAALEAARQALILNRDLGGDAVPAYRIFSLVNISRQRIDDAMEYISYALEQAGKSGQNEEMILAAYYAASINLLYGNLSKAGQFAARAEETALRLGQPEWAKKARFLRGRLCFEIGRYGDALDFFESLAEGDAAVLERGADSMSGTETSAASERLEISERSDATRGGETRAAFENRAATVRAWIFRTKNFLGRFAPHEENAAPACLDAKIFEMEVAYFAADYKRAAALADEFLLSYNADAADTFVFTEQPDWRSGFSQCEFMFQSESVLTARLARIYRSMAMCALNPPREAKAEILGEMQRFIRDDLLPDADPKDSFYFYAWYCMLRDTKAAQVDLNTIVSMAFKRLQRRAARIDDTATRRAFFTLSRWNSTLYLAAREYKLI